jgi:class 3 adenylate cyclase
MPLFMDIHKNVKDTTPQDVAAAHHNDVEAQGTYGVRYLRWWFNQDLGSIYCLVDAPNAQAAEDVHQAANGFVADEIIPIEQGELNNLLGPDEYGPAVREDPADRISTDTAFRAIVFTDLEDSTPMTQRLGDDAYVELLGIHDDLMGNCLDAHNGLRVKHTGDGLMASFASVAKAVHCMIDMQRALAGHNAGRPEAALLARMGAHAGEPVSHHDDLFGATVNLAGRISGHANAGQIVVSSVIRDLSIGKGFDYTDLGEVTLKGFVEPMRLFEVSWQP